MQTGDFYIERRVIEALRFTPIWEAWSPQTPMGKEYKRLARPFLRHERGKWLQEMEGIRLLMPLVQDQREYALLVRGMQDIEPILLNWEKGIQPGRLDWFHILQFLHKGLQVLSLPGWDIAWSLFPRRSKARWQEVLRIISPKEEEPLAKTGERIKALHSESFHFESLFPSLFQPLQEALRKLEQERLQMVRERKNRVEQELGISLSGKSPFYVSRTEKAKLEKLLNHPAFICEKETPFDLAFAWAVTEEDLFFAERKGELELAWEEAEAEASLLLAKQLIPYCSEMLLWTKGFGRLDALYGKACLAAQYKGILPDWEEDGGRIYLEGGVHPWLEEQWQREGRTFTPIDLELIRGQVAVIIGPNMGGKSVAMKTLGLCTLMAQYGFYVPATSFRFIPVDGLFLVGGEQEHLEAGLSSFGGEVKQLVELFKYGQESTLLVLCDEVGRGTNPEEGEALAMAVVEALSRRGWFTCFVSHFSAVVKLPGIQIYQMIGLPPDICSTFSKSNQTLSRLSEPSNELLPGFPNFCNWDYRLRRVERGVIPKAALHIASWLGLPREIIDRAEDFFTDKESTKKEEDIL